MKGDRKGGMTVSAWTWKNSTGNFCSHLLSHLFGNSNTAYSSRISEHFLPEHLINCVVPKTSPDIVVAWHENNNYIKLADLGKKPRIGCHACGVRKIVKESNQLECQRYDVQN